MKVYKVVCQSVHIISVDAFNEREALEEVLKDMASKLPGNAMVTDVQLEICDDSLLDLPNPPPRVLSIKEFKPNPDSLNE